MLNAIESFGKFEALAERDGISLYALGKKGLPSSFFSEWKRGKMMPETDKVLLAKYFKVSVEYFIEEDANE